MNIQVTKIVHERCFSPNSSCCTRHPIVLLAPCQRCLASVFAVTSWAAPWVTHKAVKCHYLGELVGGKKDLFSFDTKQLIFHRLACCKLSYACATAPMNSSALFVLFCLFFLRIFFIIITNINWVPMQVSGSDCCLLWSRSSHFLEIFSFNFHSHAHSNCPQKTTYSIRHTTFSFVMQLVYKRGLCASVDSTENQYILSMLG